MSEVWKIKKGIWKCVVRTWLRNWSFKSCIIKHCIYVHTLVNCTWEHVNKQVLDLRCEASRSLRDQRSYPPSPGQHPSGACWSQWLAGLPSCWDGHSVATCMWSVHHLSQICTLFPLVKHRKRREGSGDVICVFPSYDCVPLWTTGCQHRNIINTAKSASMPCVQSTVSRGRFILLSNDFTKHWATHHSWTALSPV